MGEGTRPSLCPVLSSGSRRVMQPLIQKQVCVANHCAQKASSVLSLRSVLFCEQCFFIGSPPLADSVAVIDNSGFLMASSQGQVASPTGNSMSAVQRGEIVSAKLGMVVGSQNKVSRRNGVLLRGQAASEALG